MQIPSQPATSADAAQLRRDVAPSQPAGPVAGVAEQAQKLDPRVALRWTQPVLKTEAGQFMRDSAGAAMAPAGAAAYPQLSALASLLGPWMARAEARLVSGQPPAWPEPTADDGPPPGPGQPARAAVQQALERLMTALSRSDAFAASRLAQSWWLKPAGLHTDNSPDSAMTQADAQHARWIAALSPGSDGAQQAAQLLLSGQLLWEGFLLPDLLVRMLRKDAWRGGESPERPLEKGAALDVSTELPGGLGALRVLGSQWGQDVQLQVQLPPAAQARLRERWAELEQRLQAMGLASVQLQEMPVPSGDDPGDAHGQ